MSEFSDEFRLQSTQWPRGVTVGAPAELYFRAEPRAGWLFDPGGSLRASLDHDAEYRLEFNTFFGALSLTTWCGTAGLDRITVAVRFRGSATLQIYEHNGFEEPQLLWEQRVRSDGEPLRVELQALGSHRGVLYPVFSLRRGDRLEFFDIDYFTPTPPLRAPRLAIVMPTYRREAYARRNVELIREALLEPAPARCKLFVIDNAGSLKLDAHDGVELIANRNFGGSGGFARGLLELQRSANGEAFTHVLFCDDDVLIDPQAIRRLQALLAYLGDDQVISGGMLKMGAKDQLHEKSANVVGLHFSSNKPNADMSDPIAVARYDENTFATFCGWWFVCYPLVPDPNRFLPSPYFVGWDDVEMGMRCNRLQLRTVSLLGVAIWHEEFEKKDVNWRWFYHARNGLITALLYDSGRRALRHVWIEIMTALLTYRYERARFMIDGLDAVARGSTAMVSQPADELHAQLLQEQKNPFVDVGRDLVPDRYQSKKRFSPLRSFFARVTMNGHLLPRWAFKSGDEPSHAGWAVENIHSRSLVRIFRCPSVVYYEPTTGKGMICHIDRAQFFGLLLRLQARWLRLFFGWTTLRASWRGDHARLTSAPFWRDYLGLRE